MTFRGAILAAALTLAIITQVWLALAYGSAPLDRRDAWSTALTTLLLLAGPTAAVMTAVWLIRADTIGRHLGVVIVLAGIAMRAPYFGAGPMLEDDHARYLLDGALVASGINPYLYTPVDVLSRATPVPAALVAAGRAVVEAINFPDLRSIYPGGAQILFALAHLLDPWSVDGLRILILAAEGTAAALLWGALARAGRPPVEAALLWCNPLLAYCLTGQAHMDAALMAALLAALIAAHRGAGLGAGLCLGFAVGVKLWPVLLAPLILRALWPRRTAAALFALTLAASVLLLCGPLLLASASEGSGLAAYATGWSINNTPFAWLSYGFLIAIGPGIGERALRGLVLIAAAIVSLGLARRPLEGFGDLAWRAASVAGVAFYLSPAQFPWYAAWFAPLAVAAGAWALMAATVGLPIYYLFFPLAAHGLRDIHTYGLALVHLVPVLVLAGWTLWRSNGAGFRA